MASSSKLSKPDRLSPSQQPQQQTPLKKPYGSISTTTTTVTTHKKRKLETSNTSNTNLLSSLPMEADRDYPLSSSSHLTQEELLRRRLHRLHQLSKVYRDLYWAFMEDLRAHYRHYYWKYGVSPSKDDDDRERDSNADRDFAAFNGEGCGETNNNNNNNSLISCAVAVGNNAKLGLGFGSGDGGSELKLGGNNPCAYVVCKLKAMALTNFCYLHILSDPQQQLYKACNYIIKIAQQGPILCGRPILKSTVPSLCHIHFPKAQKDVKHALKKAGLNVSSSSKLAPKFHVLVAEYVNHIQTKRKATQKLNNKSVIIKEETTS